MVTLALSKEQEISCVQAVILAREAELGGRPPTALIALAARLEAQPALSAWLIDRSRPSALPSALADRFIHAPMPPSSDYSGPPNSLVEVLARAGLDCPERLDAGVHAWLDIFSLLNPALLVCQQAPVVALAARLVGLPVIHFGPAWSIGLEPQAIRPWSDSPRQYDGALAAMLASVNTVLARNRQTAMKQLDELYAPADRVLLQGWPELDPYPRATRPRYTGAWPDAPTALAHRKSVQKTRILAVLENRAYLRKVLAWLVEEACECCLDLPVSAAETARHFTSASMTLRTDTPGQADELNADLVICHGQHEAVLEALSAGRPLLILPQWPLEQRMASQLEALGLAMVLHGAPEPSALRAALAAVLADQAMQQRALRWAQQRSSDLADPVVSVLKLCRQ